LVAAGGGVGIFTSAGLKGYALPIGLAPAICDSSFGSRPHSVLLSTKLARPRACEVDRAARRRMIKSVATIRMEVRPTERHTAMMIVVDWEFDDDALELEMLSVGNDVVCAMDADG